MRVCLSGQQLSARTPVCVLNVGVPTARLAGPRKVSHNSKAVYNVIVTVGSEGAQHTHTHTHTYLPTHTPNTLTRTSYHLLSLRACV